MNAAWLAITPHRVGECRAVQQYENECIIFNTQLSRSFFEDRDLKPTDAVIFQLTLKTLGPISTGFTTSQ